MQTKYSEIMYNTYVKEVEKSGILNLANYHPDNTDDSFSAKLASSQYLARKEFRTCHNYLIELFEQITHIENNMCKDTENIEKTYSTYKDAWGKVFEKFNDNLSKIFIYAQEKLIGSFSRKVERMDNFCICLFGRTKAGKSTTMEALTSGDGSSIGIGKQNTTQDVKKYEWKGLLVVDTPGIDAMDNKQESENIGQELENMALAFADDSDLIVFLLPHQIEEGDFEKFSKFYKQNKPILILLNIKDEIGKRDSIDFKMFLKRSDKTFNKEKIDGYKTRIKDFILSKLQIEPDLIPIIPIHSVSAFMSTQERDADTKIKLYEISNFKELENNLIREIKEYGELYRIKNPYDTVILFSEEVKEAFFGFDKYLKEQQEVFEKNILKFKDVKNEIMKKRNIIINNIISDYFNSKSNSVSSIVDRIFEEKDENKRKTILQNFISEYEVKSKVERCQTQIQSVIQDDIKNFFETFSKELRVVDIERYKSSIQSQTTSDMSEIEGLGDRSDVLAGLSTISSVVLGIGGAVVMAEVSIAGLSIFGTAGTLFGLGSTNIWNPVGWGLIIASAGLGIWSYFTSKERAKKLEKAKSKANNEIRSSVYKAKYEVERKINEWTSNVLDEIEKNHINVMEEYVSYTKKYLNEIEELSEYLEKLSEKSQKSKFQSMLRCLLENETVYVDAVVQTQKNIVVNILRSGVKIDNNIPKILARVEERPIIVFGG